MSGTDLFFVDTNVILYTVSTEEPAKQVMANDWLSAIWTPRSGRISWQIINEFYSQATRKLRIPSASAREIADHLCAWEPASQTQTTLLRAWYWCDAAQINFWDALIVASAEQCGCRYLLTEDLQANRKLGELEIINPFHRPPAEFDLIAGSN